METKRGNGASTALRCEPAWARTRPQEAHERPDLDANGDPPRARISAGRWPSFMGELSPPATWLPTAERHSPGRSWPPCAAGLRLRNSGGSSCESGRKPNTA